MYSLDDTSGDTSFSKFNIDIIPSYVFSVLKDIQSINSLMKLHIVPWSPVSVFTGIVLASSLNWLFGSACLDERQWYHERWFSSIPIRRVLYVLRKKYLNVFGGHCADDVLFGHRCYLPFKVRSGFPEQRVFCLRHFNPGSDWKLRAK